MVTLNLRDHACGRGSCPVCGGMIAGSGPRRQNVPSWLVGKRRMGKFPGFGVLLARLADYRGLSVRGLSALAAVPEPEVRAMLGGAEPGPSFLRRLAPALGLRPADIFVIAELPVPEQLAPWTARPGRWSPGLWGIPSGCRRSAGDSCWSSPGRCRSMRVPGLFRCRRATSSTRRASVPC
jgi:hypothetical protein